MKVISLFVQPLHQILHKALSTPLQKNHTNDTFAPLSKYTINKLRRAKFENFWNDKISTCWKAITYKTHKTNVAYEKYLSLIKNRRHRRTLTKLRLSDHCLAIEKGRQGKPPVIREERFCTFCPNIIEDETHFILSCKTYSTERAIFLSQINKTYPNFIKIPTE